MNRCLLPLLTIHSMLRKFLFAAVIIACAAHWTNAQSTSPANSTADSAAEQREKSKSIDSLILDAGKLFQKKDFEASGQKLAEAQDALVKLSKDCRSTVMIRLKASHGRMEKAGEMLAKNGVIVNVLPDWNELLEMRKAQGDADDGPMANALATPNSTIDFASQVAPMLVAKCGNCHIQRARGDFSMQTLARMQNGVRGATVIFPGDSVGSRLVDVIETGDMPRGGGKVSKEELTALKTWIEQGAKVNASATTALTDIAKPTTRTPAGTPAGSSAATKKDSIIASADGTGTVSFGRDVAPIFSEKCNGCHIGGNQRRGGLGLNTIAQLMRGGDSGNAVNAGNAMTSYLIKRIEGAGGEDRMPMGRPALSDKQIQLISTWIDEGAKFDGSSEDQDLDSVITETWAANASTDEIRQRAIDDSKLRWRKVLPNSEPNTLLVDPFLLIGNVSQERLQIVGGQLATSQATVFKELQITAENSPLPPLLPVFVFSGRYDYAEFGKMTESRTLPNEWQGHHRMQALDNYLVLVDNPSDPEVNENRLVQLLASATASGYGLPTWFASGVGRYVAYTNDRKSEEAKSWVELAPRALMKIKQPNDLLEQRIGEEDSALAGFALVNWLNEKTYRRKYDAFWRELQSGQSFDDAVSAKLAAPELLIRGWLGLPGK
jgi:mono/diheme cytochrome c family protein